MPLQIIHAALVKGWFEAELIALSIFSTFDVFSFYEIYIISPKAFLVSMKKAQLDRMYYVGEAEIFLQIFLCKSEIPRKLFRRKNQLFSYRKRFNLFDFFLALKLSLNSPNVLSRSRTLKIIHRLEKTNN